MKRTLEQISAQLTNLKAQARRYDAGLNDGGEGFNPHHDAIRQLEREYDVAAEARAAAGLAAIRQAEAAEWTLELTTTRRAEWNAWVKAQGKSIHTAQIAARIQAQGWSVEALKAAIKRHGL